ncbi:protein FAM83E isoform X2 [Anabas testudineus]|uniref:protein FAM83E isoform X2 n=1 Tax=Anabas testudineus TaxID=64144 RepID=UPI000E460677|nr:protein FAM83E isoform X2 [Anabas testudineus]
MSNSQVKSLDEDAVFLPVNEFSPEFFHCEKERQAVERLLSAGPEAFYSFVGTERSSCFLSPEEVRHINSWAQDYRFNQFQLQWEENGTEGYSDFCSTYFPCHSDKPSPSLDLGWPERSPWVPGFPNRNVSVHTSPPAEGEPPIREIIRRHLQNACQVIAIVTDRLTDGPVIGDLHNAASRGVPVYIILNQRSSQENFPLNSLRHPNMRVRVLGGKTFCSRTGKTVVGEMKERFILVDLETVIHGSYSLTWTDAHLHRQLITVLRGPVVESFDWEFRILFAASLPVPDTWAVEGACVDVTSQLKEFSDVQLKKQLAMEPEFTNPPSPPADSPLDWEAMGVVQLFPDNDKEIPLQNNLLFEENPPIMDGFTNQFVHMKREPNTSTRTNHVLDKSSFNTPPSPTDSATTETMKSIEQKIKKALSRQLSKEKSTSSDDRTTRLHDKLTEPAQNMVSLPSSRRSESSTRASILQDEDSTNETSTKVEMTASRKPLILRVPKSENFSTLSDIMRRIRPEQHNSGLFRRASKTAVSEMSQSMMDLSVHADTNHDEQGVSVPRFKGRGFNPDHMTPAFALMKKRHTDNKSVLQRTPKSFLPQARPRSYSFGVDMDWKSPLKEREGEQE